MSYHIYVKNIVDISFSEFLANTYLPKDIAIVGTDIDSAALPAYSKFYIPQKSSRGVTVTKDFDEYDIQLNTGASEADYYVASRIALALSELNNSDITPEFDDAMSPERFEEKYNQRWAKESELLNLHMVIHMINENGATVQLSGCKRAFYLGQKMLHRFKSNYTTEDEICKAIVEHIIQLQFIEDLHEDIHVPTLMEADFSEGTKTFIVIAPNTKSLIIKADFIILRAEENIVKITFEDFISAVKPKNKLRRVDEEQFVMQTLDDGEYDAIVLQFSKSTITKEKPKKTKRKWKFW